MMDNSVESTIEKIKLQEHDKEAKLKEKRTYEAMHMSLSRGVRDAFTHASKLKHEQQEVSTRVESLRVRLQLETSRANALADLLDRTRNELEIYQQKSIKGVSTVWNLRSQLCESVQNVSDQCDVWALFTKPKIIQPTSKKLVNDYVETTNGHGERLKNAIQRHTDLQAERDRLQNDPDVGEEFIRIKNALRYSANMAANLK